jgi:hypothetical protein
MKCIKCREPVKAKGLCVRHYHEAWELVRRGEASWADLIAEGEATADEPTKPREQRYRHREMRAKHGR